MCNSLPSYGRKLEGGKNIHFYLTWVCLQKCRKKSLFKSHYFRTVMNSKIHSIFTIEFVHSRISGSTYKLRQALISTSIHLSDLHNTYL